MGKHLQEDSFYGKVGFSLVKVGDNAIAPENTKAILELISGYGMSLETVDNKLRISANLPYFKTQEW